jgi:hypothetical protein
MYAYIHIYIGPRRMGVRKKFEPSAVTVSAPEKIAMTRLV